MVKVEALEATLGEYGMLKRGQQASVRPSVAKELSMRGIVKVVAEDDGIEDEPAKIAGGVRIKDNLTGELLMGEPRKVIVKSEVKQDTSRTVVEPEKAEEKKQVQQPEPEKKEVTHTEKKLYK